MTHVTKDTAVHFVKPLVESQGLSVSRLASGQYAIWVHRAHQEVVVSVTRQELRRLVDDLNALFQSENEESISSDG